MRVGWIHLPHLPAVAALPQHQGAPSMALATACDGVRVALEAAVQHTEDIDVPILTRQQR